MYAGAVTRAACSGERRGVSVLPRSEAYTAAIARAVTLAPAGMSAASTSGRLPISAFGNTASGIARTIGLSGSRSAVQSGASGGRGASSSTASAPW